MPKLVILGTNDAYWPINALSFYWAGLPEPKHALYIPNAGHSLDDEERLIGSVVAFSRALVFGEPLPRVSWEVKPGPSGATLRAFASTEPEAARYWIAVSPIRDFRGARWEERPLPGGSKEFAAEIPRPGEGWCAFFAEFVFSVGGERLFVSTPAYVYP
jgi:PhoPQ-activated pathogenicity-related protein